MLDTSNLTVPIYATIQETMLKLDKGAKGVVFVLDDTARLAGVVTDGDIRRGILTGLDMDRPVTDIINSGFMSVGYSVSKEEAFRRMSQASIRHMPVLDDSGRLMGMYALTELIGKEVGVKAVVMAGGFGTRLKPLTDNIPKPMLPLGNRPMLEYTLERLKLAGISEVTITTHHKAQVIKDHFGNEWQGLSVKYFDEKEPLGTVGALRHIDMEGCPVLLMNGDVLTAVDLSGMISFHYEHESWITVGCSNYSLDIPYGVVDSIGVYVRDIVEKPKYTYLTAAGIYILDPLAVSLIPQHKSRYDMPDLIKEAIRRRLRVSSFPIREYWLDIGRMGDYEKAQADVSGA